MTSLRRQETTGTGLKRIACAQVETAIRCLTRQAGQGTAASDAIRQTQSLLALMEPDLPRPAVRRDRAILARLGSGLNEITEPALLAEQLHRRYKKGPADAALASAVKTLRKRWATRGRSGSALNNKAGSFNPAIYRLVADMAELRGHVGDWPTESITDEQPPRGLRRTYTRARKLANEPTTASTLPPLALALTELSDQLGIIGKACPTMIKAQRKLLTRAADELNDLIVSDKLHSALRSELSKDDAKALPNKKPLTRRVADAVGSDLDSALAETPAAFMKRMQAYWLVWRDESS